MREASSAHPIVDAMQSFSDLLEQGTRISMDLLESLSRTRMPDMMSGMLQQFGIPGVHQKQACRCHPHREGCGCRIPPPCWAPQPLGEVVSHVCAGGTASVRVCVTNCGARQRDIKLEIGGNATGVTVTPSVLSLGPMERGCVAASAAMPPDASSCEEKDVLLWVRGCQDHYLCWTIRVARRGTDCSCHEVDVCDCPDLIHHWYDHFYCERPCVHRYH